MATPFKERIGPDAVERIAALIPGDWDRAGFVASASRGLEALELKARVHHIAAALREALPDDYPTALGMILEGLDEPPEHTDGLTESFELWPLTAFVREYGLAHPGLSLDAMPRLTPHWSCEFAIRPYFRDDPDGVLARLQAWAEHDNPHVRRLVSEGSRPRLPWGIRLQHRIDHPETMLPILARLRDDPSAYVRRSVANHLNDIAKDHPELVLQTATDWLVDAPDTRRKLVKHALRTLIKAGDPRAYALIGLLPFEGTVSITVQPRAISVGEALMVSVSLASTASRSQRVRLDLGVHHRRKNGTLSAKVFHWTERTVKPGETLELVKQHRVRKVTTRKLYAGEQAIDVRVNGEPTPPVSFSLGLPD